MIYPLSELRRPPWPIKTCKPIFSLAVNSAAVPRRGHIAHDPPHGVRTLTLPSPRTGSPLLMSLLTICLVHRSSSANSDFVEVSKSSSIKCLQILVNDQVNSGYARSPRDQS